MFTARIIFFRLHESPRYLVSAGRHQEALESLQLIARFNGDDLALRLADVQDVFVASPVGDDDGHRRSSTHSNRSASPPTRPGRHPTRMTSETGLFNGAPVTGYESINGSPEDEEGERKSEDAAQHPPSPPRRARSAPQLRPHSHRMSTASSMKLHEVEGFCCGWLPGVLRRPLVGWLDRISVVLDDEWRRTTVLVWCAWFSMSLGVWPSPLLIDSLVHMLTAQCESFHDV
jgi:hypothetical protein